MKKKPYKLLQVKSPVSGVKLHKKLPFFKPLIQPKSTINQPNDIYEQEANAAADKVMHQNTKDEQNEFFKPAILRLDHSQKDHATVEQNKEIIHNGINNNINNDNGRQLSKEVLDFYEPRFGHDFNKVRIHTDSNAAKSAQLINASAYTFGNNIVFDSGEYSPGTENGKRLLSHELTHVVQQGGQPNFVQRYPKGPGIVPDFLKERIDNALILMQSSAHAYEVSLANDILNASIDIAVPDFFDMSKSPVEPMPADAAFNRKQMWEQGITPDLQIEAHLPATGRKIPVEKGADAITLHHGDYEGIIYLLSLQQPKPLATTLLHEALHLMNPLGILPNQPGAEKEIFMAEIRSYYYAQYRDIKNTERRFERAVKDAEKDTAYLAGEGITIEQVLANREKWMIDVGEPY